MLSKRDIAWYNLAMKIAADSNAPDPHGCVLVRSGTVLGVATNRYIETRSDKKRGHAEQRVLFRLGRAATAGATLYSARNHKNPINAPCWVCDILLPVFGLKYVVFHNGQMLEKKRVR